MSKYKTIPGSILTSAFGLEQQRALNAFNTAVDDINVATNALDTSAAITANNALYISKALLKSTTAAAIDFAAFKVAIAAIP